MNGSTNSISVQLEQALTLQENSVRIANAFREGVISTKTSISVELLNMDGTTFTIDIPTNISLGNRLDNLTRTLENLIGVTKDGHSRLISTASSTISELVIKSASMTEAQKLTSDDIQMREEIQINNNAILESLLSPLPTLELSIPNNLDTTNYFVEKYIFDEAVQLPNQIGIDGGGISFKEMMKYLTSNKIEYKVVKNIVSINPRVKRFYGTFKIQESVIDGLKIVAKVDKVTYHDKNSIVDDSKSLQIDDIVAKSDYSIKYKVVGINQGTLTLETLSGIGSVVVGDELVYVDHISTDEISISVPVKLNENSVIFLTPVNNLNNSCGLISDGVIFSSANYFVTSNYNEIPFNEYFSSKISDISSHFSSILSENVIPINLAIVPTSPVLEEKNFKVLQINKHLTNSPISTKLEKLQNEKSITENQLTVIQNTISNLNSKINSGNYASTSKRDADKSLLTTKIQERDEKTTLLSSIVQNIDSTVSTSSKDAFKPKYRLRGFWKLNPDMESEQTRNQKVIQYEVRYRYTTLKSNTSTSEQFIYSDGDSDITAVISPWNYIMTSQLSRIVKEDKTVEWVANDENSIDEININQLDIPISYGESVEFQLRAISEAGWPTCSIKSDWSKIIRKEFGDEIAKLSTIQSIIDKNEQDILSVKIENKFRDQGYTRHIANAYTEQEKYFSHNLDDISSGKRTTDQKTISALEYVQTLESKISELNEIVNRRYSSASIQIVDDTSMLTYDVNNFSTIKLFGGNYTDEVDLSVNENYGGIVTKKFYLKLTNQNAQTIEMLSIAPGGLQQNVMSEKYAKIPVRINTEGFVNQRKGQLFYNRLQNIDLTRSLYGTDIQSEYTIPQGDIDTGANIVERNVVHKSTAGTIDAVKLLNSANLESYVALTIDHPAYLNYKSTGSITEINEVFERIENFNKLFRDPSQQPLLQDSNLHGFEINDKYLIGQNSVGAALYVALNDFTSFQVNGVDSSSSKEIYAGEQDSILIPIIFQYRMTDALGNVNGLQSLNANSNFEYSKTIGFDLFINNKLFSFDVEVYATYRPSTTANQRLNIVESSNNIRTKIS